MLFEIIPDIGNNIRALSGATYFAELNMQAKYFDYSLT